MKAKRIVSILLTGSMLLSLLPVSALAATPVFDAPAQTTAKKAAPLVQEADASRSTEEEAATRSSRDLDAENGTADSITIQLNAEGKPESEGDSEHWAYDYATSFSLNLRQGTFTLQPSSEPGAESALQTDLDIYKDAEFNGGTVGKRAHNEGTISNGTFQWEVYNYGTISDGTFQGKLHNYQTISDGTFQGKMYNSGTISGGIFKLTVTAEAIFQPAQIEGGTFEDGMKIYPDAYYPTTITDGLFDGKVFTEAGSLIKPLTISGGLFTKAVDVSNITNLPNLQITGGYFVSKPTVPEGSVSFTSVSDQNGRTFQVRVNGGFSKNGYEALYVPHGMSERQANPITVKTDTALTDCLADGESIMGTDKVRKNNDGSYTIEVYQPESIVLVTEKPAPSTPDEPGDEIDPAFSSGAAALGIVLGTAGLGYVAYINGTSLYLHYALPGGFIPSTRQELANVLWTTAGKPDPVSTALYTDIPADAIEQQKAARWCVEQGLLSDYGATFGPDTTVTNARIIRAWNRLKKLPVTITK
ncbi:hypothetical protein GPK62_06760 [Faecalibacterium prausnitzii]|uniref:hypothetical protein n=1 Tax=Faecalibacterium prausnitzii TaxID=853 RepID=UPI001C036759|nr:hypothetical protein [Faecalibacterium prausnitzii]MBT9707065.1 hypothetical protein [Faecalibacterium prausnitzii]